MARFTYQRRDFVDAVVPDWAVTPKRFGETQYSLGNKEIDDQHHHILCLLNSLDLAHHSGEGAAHSDLLLNHLCAYLDRHFNHEERLMAEHGYPKRKQHQQQHSECREKLRKMIVVVNGTGTRALDCATFIHEWMHNHLLGSDREFAMWLQHTRRYRQ